jgi:hypothetical protein
VIADLDGPEFTGAVLPNLVGFTDRGVVGGHGSHRTCRTIAFQGFGDFLFCFSIALSIAS